VLGVAGDLDQLLAGTIVRPTWRGVTMRYVTTLQCSTELTLPGGGRGVEHATVQLFHCGCDSEVWTWYEQAGNS
jgi:hypothetical protein